jgi:hypothetical protein
MAESTNKNETTLKKRLAKLEELRDFLPTHPYSIVLRLRLAKAYKDLGYPDLAVGDAYKALLLADELGEEGEFQEETLSAALVDFRSKRALNFVYESQDRFAGWFTGLDYSRCWCNRVFDFEDAVEKGGNEILTRAKECWSKTAYAPSPPHLVAWSASLSRK